MLAPLGMLYVGRLRLALYYLLVAMLAGAVDSLRLLEGLGLPGSVSPTVLVIVACCIHSIYLATSLPVRIRRPWYSRWYGLAGFYFLIFLSAFLFRAFLLEPFVYPHPTMLPAIEPGSKILVQKWGYGNYGSLGLELLRTEAAARTEHIERGDVVAFEHPEDRAAHLVQRVIGLPGDRVELQGQTVVVNGASLAHQEVHVNRAFRYAMVEEKLNGTAYKVIYSKENLPRGNRVQVPEASYLLLGDNRTLTVADQYWTVTPSDHLIGKVIATW